MFRRWQHETIFFLLCVVFSLADTNTLAAVIANNGIGLEMLEFSCIGTSLLGLPDKCLCSFKITIVIRCNVCDKVSRMVVANRLAFNHQFTLWFVHSGTPELYSQFGIQWWEQ